MHKDCNENADEDFNSAPRRPRPPSRAAAPQALKFASATEFGHLSSRERPPASIFHETFEISDFASDLDLAKSHVKTIFLDATAQPIPPTNISQQTDGRKLKSIGPISRNVRKLD